MYIYKNDILEFRIKENFKFQTNAFFKLGKHVWFRAWYLRDGGGSPATTISRPSHILLSFSSEPPRNPRPSIIYVFKIF